ncbi:hypothetical protein I6J72_05590 [Corynebacterium sp. FDAARGOS 1242]|uniref:hypothetical protein n=1 Tax=Corynebacterium sp. FDAARGOS 1242 TaxID=2778078 RepID=UPI00195122F5|nr:hypothetical protein [Corynebacterium sp. FDAARGOS 1242]QRP98973.1 hypothetical protein I6J72_05590 [Corynebacterium sp. FDAARGOS 1242]
MIADLIPYIVLGVFLGIPGVMVGVISKKVSRLEAEVESAWDVLRGMSSALRSLSSALSEEGKPSIPDDFPGTVEMNFIHKYGDPEP